MASVGGFERERDRGHVAGGAEAVAGRVGQGDQHLAGHLVDLPQLDNGRAGQVPCQRGRLELGDRPIGILLAWSGCRYLGMV